MLLFQFLYDLIKKLIAYIFRLPDLLVTKFEVLLIKFFSTCYGIESYYHTTVDLRIIHFKYTIEFFRKIQKFLIWTLPANSVLTSVPLYFFLRPVKLHIIWILDLNVLIKPRKQLWICNTLFLYTILAISKLIQFM